MSDSVKRYEPMATVELAVPGVSASSISGVTVILRVGGWSTASLNFHPRDAEDRVTKVFSKDVAKTLGAIQAAGFSDRLTSDAIIILDDGKNDTISFSGMTTSPSYTLMPGYLSRTMELVHEAALIDGIKTGIYEWRGLIWSEFEKTISAKSWGMFMHKVLQFLMDKGRDNWKYLTSADSEITTECHQLNTQLMPILDQILQESAETTKSDSLSKMVEKSDLGITNSIGQTMLAYYRSCREGFWGTLNQMCSAFQLLYVPPGKNGGYGKLIRLQDALLGEPETKQLSILQCGFRFAASSVLPLQQVLLRASGQTLWALNLQDFQPRVMAVWPQSKDTRTTGQVLDTSAPAWIMPMDSKDKSKGPGPAVTLKAPGGSDVVTLTAYQKENTLIRRSMPATDTLINSFLEEYARALYVDRCLAGATFTATVPLDVSWEPGKRYTVQDGGEQLFTGFLAMATHTASVEPGNGQARTRLDFSHVELGDFKLTGA